MSSATAGSNFLSLTELQRVWVESFDQFTDNQGPNGYHRHSIATLKAFTSDKQKDICKRLADGTRDPETHFRDLSGILSDSLACLVLHGEEIDPTTACTRALGILARLPHTSSALNMTFLDSIEAPNIHRYCLEYAFSSPANRIDWGSLVVTSHTSRTVGHFALLVSLLLSEDLKREPWSWETFRITMACTHMQTVLNKIASLVDTASSELSQTSEASCKLGYFLAKAFLWTTWQKCMTLFSFWQLYVTVYSLNLDRDGFILETINIELPSSIGSQNVCARLDIRPPDYICRWAFEALYSSKKTQALDFQLFLTRLNTQFGSVPPRCLVDRQCDGQSPYSCQRFVGGKVDDQSAHDLRYCISRGNCDKLIWDEHSYKGVRGGRAVSLYSDVAGGLKYVKVSTSTLVISHVWIHGQGGRPETGINSCLHDRYTSIAKAAGCDSYWIDTACIPSDHLLRIDAIRDINTTFMIGKMTLVCDKDLMAIDVSNLNLAKQELILATLLICDWNLRAWTMLEAFKGWSNLHVLCKDNKTVSVYATLQLVLQNGRIDICCAFLGSMHLIPKLYRSDNWETVGEEPQIVQAGPARTLNVDKAGSLLSHRPASRPGDEIVIWSLMCGGKVYDNAETFWTQAEYGWGFSSLYLISSAPRLQNLPGFSWAPARPNIKPPESASQEEYIPALEMESEHLVFNSAGKRGEGLDGEWFVSLFDTSSEEAMYPKQVLQAMAQYTSNYKWMALLQAAALMPRPRRPLQYIWKSCHSIVAVVGSNDQARWEWKGVYAWNHEMEDLPAFEYQRLKLI